MGRGAAENGMPQRKGLGTGFILRDDGTIVTNNHVVRGAQSIRVRLSDGREFDASILGADPETDVAVLHIDAKGLPAAKLMESKDIEVGDWVLALGSPFGLEQTVTAGIISAKGRDHVGLATFENYLQTDAAINPGNSGGPLCSLDGAVVGMNTAIGSGGGGGNDGVGFAIPMEMVKRAADALVQDGRVRYGYIGVLLQEVPGIDGAVIGDVVAGGPADKAGLQPGDVIVQVDGVATTSRAALTRTVGTHEPGTMVKVHALRNGEDVHAEVKLAVRPSSGVAVRDERGGVLQPNR
jgi:serine protease Do